MKATAWALLLTAVAHSPTAPAYGNAGHQQIGAIADLQLHDAARRQVQTLLGFDLRVAAVWADCVRDAQPDASGEPQADKPAAACAAFGSPAQRERMQDYARRNWSGCDDPPPKGCHSRYHYTNIAYQHQRYDRAYSGTRDDDLVAATNAAIAVLRNRAAPPPFDIRDKTEALLLLAHFVGDLHQPLHIGTAYLDRDGRSFDPDGDAPVAEPQANTRGGNLIHDPISNLSLHADWDRIARALGAASPRLLIGRRSAIPPTSGPIDSWAAQWAGETLRASHPAYAGLSFIADPAAPGRWIAQFPDHAAYWRDKETLQRGELIKAGTRLAQLLNAIWS